MSEKKLWHIQYYQGGLYVGPAWEIESAIKPVRLANQNKPSVNATYHVYEPEQCPECNDCSITEVAFLAQQRDGETPVCPDCYAKRMGHTEDHAKIVEMKFLSSLDM